MRIVIHYLSKEKLVQYQSKKGKQLHKFIQKSKKYESKNPRARACNKLSVKVEINL